MTARMKQDKRYYCPKPKTSNKHYYCPKTEESPAWRPARRQTDIGRASGEPKKEA